MPMLVLALVWLALFVVEVVWGLSPFLAGVGYVVWAAFLLQFLLEFLIAPHKVQYLRQNWLGALALVLPAFRLFGVFRATRVLSVSRAAGMARGARLVQVLGSLGRSMRQLRATMSRQGAGYVLLFTLVVMFAGAAGMYAFERETFDSYWTALWWTAMLVTTIGSQYWPQSVEGRILCLLLSIYSIGVFGYITATLATFFIGRDAKSDEGEIVSGESIAALREEIRELKEELRRR
jgi:voltage-gated potassium channel